MRYVSQQEVSKFNYTSNEETNVRIEDAAKRKCFERLMGELQKSIQPDKTERDSSGSDRFTLELQIFDQFQWMRFKKRLKDFLAASRVVNSTFLDTVMVGKMINELESEQIQTEKPKNYYHVNR